jgi:hypothetical protein
MIRSETPSQRPICAPKPLGRALALACILATPFAASAQVVPIPFESEGVVTSVSMRPDGSGVDLTVFGRNMYVPHNAKIHTPTAELDIYQLADPSRFPGLNRDGFVGSTAILIGEVEIAPDGTATPMITDVAIEPAETVLLGVVTKNEAGSMELLGIPLAESTDARLPSEGYHNEFGFTVYPATIPVGTSAAVEGYYGDDGIFRHFLVEAAGGVLTEPTTPQSSVLRARCSPGGSLEVQGASYLPASAIVEFRNLVTSYRFGSITTTPVLESPEFGTYRYRVIVNDGAVDSDGACPSQVLAINLTNNTQASASVDGVVAPPPPPEPTDNEPPVAVADAGTVIVGLATEIHLTLNDIDVNGNIDNTSVVLYDVPPELVVENTLDGDVLVTASAAGAYTFSYTVADTDGAVSSLATVTITAEPAAAVQIDITQATFRNDKNRWNIRGTTNQAGATMTGVLLRTGQTIGTVTSDPTGGWQIDVRNSPVRPVAGDIVRVTSSAGGSDDQVVTIAR